MSLGHLLIARVVLLPGHWAWHGQAIGEFGDAASADTQNPEKPWFFIPFPIVSPHGQWIWCTWRCCPSLEKKKQHVEQVGYGSRPPAA